MPYLDPGKERERHRRRRANPAERAKENARDRERMRAKAASRTPEELDAYNARKRELHALGKWTKHRYGITVEQYEAMLEAQGGVCAICKLPERHLLKSKPRRLSVDHDHGTGKVRGLLCHNCNTGLGAFRDRPELMEAGAAYVRASR